MNRMIAVLFLLAALVGPVQALGKRRAKPVAPLRVTTLQYNVPSGISYDPSQAIRIKLTLKNTGKEDLNLQGAHWRIRRTREMLGDPKNIWETKWTHFETLATNAVDAEHKALKPDAELPLQATFTPKKYGTFTLILTLPWENKTVDLELCCAAVIYPPAKGFKPKSFYQVGMAHPGRDNTAARLDIAGRFGFKWVRWGNCCVRPRKRGATEYNWSETDRIVDILRRNNILIQGSLMPYGVTPEPRLGGKPITYTRGKANLVTQPEHFGKPGEFGSLADHVYQVVNRYKDIYVDGYVRNEPWEGGSISNYHATAAHMRELIKVCHDAAKKANPKFRFVGLDSIDNLNDQVTVVPGMADYIDATSHHNYGNSFKDNRGVIQSRAMGKPALENENWGSPADTFVIGNITQKLAGGYTMVHPVARGYQVSPYGNKSAELASPRPIGQVCATWLHFVEDTDHAEELYPGALPYINLFKGRRGYDKKHVAVVVGRIKMYGGSYREDHGDGFFPQVKSFGVLTVADPAGDIVAYDIEGNPVTDRRQDGKLLLPLTEEPYYLVSKKGYDDLHRKLKAARAAYEGHGCQAGLLDITRPFDQRQVVRVLVENRILRPQTLQVKLTPPAGWTLAKDLLRAELQPGEQREVAFAVKQARPNGRNSYSFKVDVTAANGTLTVKEDLHVTLIRQGTPKIDGDLGEWEKLGAVPVMAVGGKVDVDPGVKLWFPMYKFAAADESAVIARFAAMWDETNFYVMAEVTDATEDFRPPAAGGIRHLTHKDFPYLYWGRTFPIFRGTKGDALRLVFDVHAVPDKRDPWIPREWLKQLDTRFHKLHPDYEYDLYAAKQNRVVDDYDTVLKRHLERLKDRKNKAYRQHWPPFEEPKIEYTGPMTPEVWRFKAPGIPLHNAYPYSPKQKPVDQGQVQGAQFVLQRDGKVWRYEAAIPWTELRDVQPTADKEVRFAWVVLNNGRRALDWGRNRSAAFHRIQVQHPTWQTAAWTNTRWRFLGPK